MAYHKCASIYGTNNSAASVQTASGAIANFNTKLAMPLKSLEIDVNATGGGGTPSTAIPIEGINEIKVGYVDFNQLLQISRIRDSTVVSDVTITNNYDGSINISGTASASILKNIAFIGMFYQNHIYYLGNGINCSFTDGYGDGVNIAKWNRANDNANLFLRITNGAQVNEKVYLMCFDLTQMFGSNIADYIYSLEQTNAGAGVSLIKQLLPKTYYNYDTGGTIVTLDSVNGEPTCPNAVINLGGTYYGGHFTQDKDGHRQFEVTHAKYVITGNEAFSATGSGQHVFAGNVSIYDTLKLVTNDSVLVDIKCTVAQAKTYSSLNVAGTTDGIGVGYRFLIVGSEQYDNWANLAGEEIVYELKTPYVIDLPDGTPIKTLPGVNNIYADTGDTKVSYKKLA